MKMKYIVYIIATITMLTPLLGTAQDGEGLFKSKCNVCHLVDAHSTGPNLKGVQAKWEEAGEGEMLYDWVKNPKALFDSGKSEMAKKIKSFSGADMSPQPISNEEIDAIMSYVDNYEKPAEVTETPTGDPVEVTYVPNYEENLDLFYALIAMTIFLLIAIILMSGTVTRFIKTDYFKDRVKDAGNNPLLKSIVVLIGFTFAFSNNTQAFTFVAPGEGAEGSPWLLIENIDIYVLVAINILLVFVLLYIKRVMRLFVSMTEPEAEVVIENNDEVFKKVNQVLTSAVPIEEEHTILLHHEYDGIKELDNNLPPWWVWLFYATIAFGIIYIFHYHILHTGDLQVAEYNKEMIRAEKEKVAYLEANAMNVTAETVVVLTDSDNISKGKVFFSNKCVACHDTKGQGNTAPNLTDKNWIYGFEIKDVFTSIQDGRPAGGMPAHAAEFNPLQIQQIASYVLSLPETKGRDPEGDIIEK